MLYQLNTSDHAVMGVFLKNARPLTAKEVAVLSETSASKVSAAIFKLVDYGFLRRVEDGAHPSYRMVLDCPYFPPVTAVTGRALSYEDPELKSLVDNVTSRF